MCGNEDDDGGGGDGGDSNNSDDDVVQVCIHLISGRRRRSCRRFLGVSENAI